MPLIREGVPACDPWTQAADEAALPQGPAVVSLARWQAERETLIARNEPLGIRLKSSEAPEAIAADVARFDLICLEFPKFQDGRAYSHARKLRQRHGFTGELRAVGNVLRDQFLFMQRCGFDAFEVKDAGAVRDWQRAMSEISVAYQPAADRRRTAVELRTESSDH
jgi:uncharacterized protein (DUF934 family)